MIASKEMRLLRQTMKDELKKQDIRLNKLCFDYQEKEKRIAELEQENAKAKEIIKELLDTQRQLDPYRNIFKDRILKAEQFLSEVEK